MRTWKFPPILVWPEAVNDTFIALVWLLITKLDNYFSFNLCWQTFLVHCNLKGVGGGGAGRAKSPCNDLRKLVQGAGKPLTGITLSFHPLPLPLEFCFLAAVLHQQKNKRYPKLFWPVSAIPISPQTPSLQWRHYLFIVLFSGRATLQVEELAAGCGQ